MPLSVSSAPRSQKSIASRSRNCRGTQDVGLNAPRTVAGKWPDFRACSLNALQTCNSSNGPSQAANPPSYEIFSACASGDAPRTGVASKTFSAIKKTASGASTAPMCDTRRNSHRRSRSSWIRRRKWRRSRIHAAALLLTIASSPGTASAEVASPSAQRGLVFYGPTVRSATPSIGWARVHSLRRRRSARCTASIRSRVFRSLCRGDRPATHRCRNSSSIPVRPTTSSRSSRRSNRSDKSATDPDQEPAGLLIHAGRLAALKADFAEPVPCSGRPPP